MKRKSFYCLLLPIILHYGCTSFSEVKLNKAQLLAKNGIKSMIAKNEKNQIVKEESYYSNGEIKSYRSYGYSKNDKKQIVSEGSFYPNCKKKSETIYMYGFGVGNQGNRYMEMGQTNNSIFIKQTTKYNEKERPIEEVHIGNNGIRSYLLTYHWDGDKATLEEYQGNKRSPQKYVKYYDGYNNEIKSIDITNNYMYRIAEYQYNNYGDDYITYEKSILYNKDGSVSFYSEKKRDFKYDLDKQLIKETEYGKIDANNEYAFVHDISYAYNKNNKLIEKNTKSSWGDFTETIKYNTRGLIDSKKSVKGNGEISSFENFTYYDSGLPKSKETEKGTWFYTYID